MVKGEALVEQSDRKNSLWRWRSATRAGATVTAIMLLLSGCSDDANGDKADSSRVTVPAVASTVKRSTATAPVPTPEDGLILIFNDLDDNADAVIPVYPGVSESEVDKQLNGTFNPNERVRVICKTIGRTVNSHPENGDEERHSNEWVRIVGSPGTVQFASMTYADMASQTFAALPQCPPPPYQPTN